jgi:hypothetical protein
MTKRAADDDVAPQPKRHHAEPAFLRVITTRDVLFIVMCLLGGIVASRLRRVCRATRDAVGALPHACNFVFDANAFALMGMQGTWVTPHVQSITLQVTAHAATNAVLLMLPRFARLRTLIVECEFAVREWALVFRAMPRLTRLELHLLAARLPAALSHVAHLRALGRLNIGHSLNVQADADALDLACLRHMPCLWELIVAYEHDDITLSAEQMHHVAACARLRKLRAGKMLPSNNSRDRGADAARTWTALVDHPSLTRIELESERFVCAHVLSYLSRVPLLAHLNVRVTADMDAWHALSRMACLTDLTIRVEGVPRALAMCAAVPPSVCALTLEPVYASDADPRWWLCEADVRALGHTRACPRCTCATCTFSSRRCAGSPRSRICASCTSPSAHTITTRSSRSCARCLRSRSCACCALRTRRARPTRFCASCCASAACHADAPLPLCKQYEFDNFFVCCNNRTIT